MKVVWNVSRELLELETGYWILDTGLVEWKDGRMGQTL